MDVLFVQRIISSSCPFFLLSCGYKNQSREKSTEKLGALGDTVDAQLSKAELSGLRVGIGWWWWRGGSGGGGNRFLSVAQIDITGQAKHDSSYNQLTETNRVA